MRMKRGDTYLEEFRLTWMDGSPVDLTDADHVNFICKKDGDDTPKIDRNTLITGAEDGLVIFDFEAQDTEESGMYNYEFQIVYNTGDIMTVPQNKILWLLIIDDLNS